MAKQRRNRKGFFQEWAETFAAMNAGVQANIRANIVNRAEDLASVKADGVLNEVLDKSLMRTVVQMQHWRLGLSMWEDSHAPDRSYMYQIYQELALDAQVAAKMGIAHNKMEASEFFFVNPKTGEENKELTEKFRTEWFSKYLRESLNSTYYGYTLFQFPELNAQGTFTANDLKVIPRHLVLPNVKDANGKKDGIVLPSAGSNSGVSFMRGKYSHRLLGVGEEDSFGMFAAIAPLYIYKKNAMSFWSGYQQRYGEPTMAINMNTWNKKNHQNYQNFLKNRSTNSGLILRNEDKAEMLEAYRTDAYNLYHEMMQYCDAGISKTMEGNTQTSDASGSKATGAAHADTGHIFHLGTLKKLAYSVNDHLTPFLEKEFGWEFGEDVFRWKEFKDVDAEVDNVMKLTTNFKMESDEVFKRTGYMVGEMLEKNADARAGNRKKSPDKDDKVKRD